MKTNVPADSVDELRQALYKLIGDVSDETQHWLETKQRLIRLPMDARIDAIMSLIARHTQQAVEAAETKLIEAIQGEMPKRAEEFNGVTWRTVPQQVGYNQALKDVTAMLKRHKTKPEPPAQQEGTE